MIHFFLRGIRIALDEGLPRHDLAGLSHAQGCRSRGEELFPPVHTNKIFRRRAAELRDLVIDDLVTIPVDSRQGDLYDFSGCFIEEDSMLGACIKMGQARLRPLRVRASFNPSHQLVRFPLLLPVYLAVPIAMRDLRD